MLWRVQRTVRRPSTGTSKQERIFCTISMATAFDAVTEPSLHRVSLCTVPTRRSHASCSPSCSQLERPKESDCGHQLKVLVGKHSFPSFRYFWRLENSLDHLRLRSLIIANIDCLHCQPWIWPGFQVPTVSGPHGTALSNLNIKSGPQRLDRSFQKPWQLQLPLLLPTWTPGTADLHLTRSDRINVSDANRTFVPAVDRPIFADASRAQPLVRVLEGQIARSNTRSARLDERRLLEKVGHDARCLRLDRPQYLVGLVRLGQMQLAGKWRIPKYPVRP